MAEQEAAPVNEALDVPLTKDLLSTGSTLLNLACTGTANGGFSKGRYFFIVGDSASGKTFLSMTCLAEATLNTEFAGYRFIYDNAEDGMQMNLDKLFNEEVADRMVPPRTDEHGAALFSGSIEDFYYNLDDALRIAGWDSVKRTYTPSAANRPFIYILDSMDALDDDDAAKKFAQLKGVARKVKGKGKRGADGEEEEEKKVTGSYGMSKAKKNSQDLRRAMAGLRRTGSILIILSQTRDNIDQFSFEKKTRAGGRALRFYATLEIWSSIYKKITKTVNDKAREVGVHVELAVKKNRCTGKTSKVIVDIYPSHGIDDLGTCVDYLVEEGYWEEDGQIIDAKGLNLTASRDKIIRVIEAKGLEAKVRGLCEKCWAEIEAKCALVRKNRYAKPE